MRAGARIDAAGWRPAHSPSVALAALPHADLRAVLAALAAGPRLAPAVDAEWQLPPHALWVAMAPDRLAQTLRRLLELAAGLLAPAGGLLRIHARAEGATAALSVVDLPTGGQVPQLAHCVHRFAQSAGALQAPAQQALARCAQAIDAHRGRLYAAPSIGGRMGATLRLPLVRDTRGQA